jgi:hypothetical protein
MCAPLHRLQPFPQLFLKIWAYRGPVFVAASTEFVHIKGLWQFHEGFQRKLDTPESPPGSFPPGQSSFIFFIQTFQGRLSLLELISPV